MAAIHNLLFASIGGPVESFLVEALRDQGYNVLLASGLDELLQQLRQPIDLLLLNLFAASDLEVVRTARSHSTCALIVIGPPRAAQLLVAALECGADDYVQRPFRTDELLARIRARLRRIGRNEPTRLQIGRLHLDLGLRQATRNGQLVDLSPFEILLLTTLAAHPSQKQRASGLLEQVWGARHVQDVELLQTAIHHLRLAIESDASAPEVLCGDLRQGYWLSLQMREAST
jgi:two-component system, OmpR family, response regulator MtrA